MIVITSRIRVTGGDADALAVRYRNRVGLVDTLPGCLGVEILRHVDRPEEFMVVTRWTDEDAYAAYRAHPAFRKAHRAIAELPGLRIDPTSRVVERYGVLS